MELGIEALRAARVDAPKMAPSRSLATGKTYVRQFVSGIRHQGSETTVRLFRRLRLPIRGTLQNVAVSSVIYTRLRGRSLTISQESMASVLLHHTSQFTARHEDHAAILLCREESKARSSIPAAFLSRPHASLAPNSCVRSRSLFDITPNNHPPLGCGLHT